jgi:hypothetical protein
MFVDRDVWSFAQIKNSLFSGNDADPNQLIHSAK